MNSLNDICQRILGYYEVLIPAEYKAMPLTRLSAIGVYYFDAVPTDSGIKLKISIFSMARALAASREHGFEMTVTAGVGLPFLAHRYRHRFGVYVGAVIFCLMLLASQLFVWQIEVEGNKRLSDSEIMHIAEHAGVYVGAFIPDIRVFSSEAKMLLSEQELSSVSINIDGTHITIDLIERVHAPEIYDFDQICDIVASEDGVITRVEAARGAPIVNVGDRVTGGQTLISGDVVTDEGYQYYCRAFGNVYAETEHDFVGRVYTELTCKRYTGRTQHKSSLSFIGHEILGQNGECDFEYADCRSVSREIKLFGMSTAVTVTDLYYSEFEYSSFTIDSQSAKNRCLLLLKQHIDELDGEVKSRYYEINKTGDAYTINAHITVIKNIALTKRQSIVPPSSPSARESNEST